MIAVDTSALIAVVAGEEPARACEQILISSELIMSAGTLTEALIVSSRKHVRPELQRLLSVLDLRIENVTPDFARRAAAVYDRWGKGVDSASLNYGDCFSYAVAELHDCPLLFIGDDFSRTDIRSALG
ncbi:MAG TPA: type II toxin-antitoxin system VapC family toxin [Brevundimonas sp.]|jgi:ribonuclease VapC